MSVMVIIVCFYVNLDEIIRLSVFFLIDSLMCCEI